MNHASPWARRLPGPTPARHRLVCFPHAGGGASAYRPWRDLLPPDVELLAVQYPGREERTAEPFAEDMAELTDRLAEGLAPLLDGPFTFFGHSLGAVVAYEVAHRWERAGYPVPDHLIVSSQYAPPSVTSGGVHERDDDGLLEELARLGGVGPRELAAPGLRELIVPVVRADYRLLDSYDPSAAEPLDVPVTAFCGTGDPALGAEDVAEWADFTRAGFTLRLLDGGHFYLRDHPAEAVAAVTALLPQPLSPQPLSPQK
ncbi:alpha/beta fold hydrolase [Streptomyces sp. NPDC049577]|uniref:thioesterase II family protein n=1 Tax=Streptomyces sp. NPDC049577 TaxID=3155153 RepID=UPI0034136805